MHRVLVSGATGFIGSALVHRLVAEGIAVRRLTRRAPAAGSDDVRWDPTRGEIDPRALDGVDGVVHLAGEKIDQRWTTRLKHELRESRVRGTGLIARAVASAPTRPRVLVSGSAVGIYGDRGDELLDETSPPGDDFLARLAVEWEASARPAADAGVRVVHPRTGIVLSPRGGALARMLPPFRLGVGGPTGSGHQWMSWIALDDMVEALLFALRTEALAGPVNLTAPEPVRNAELTTTLGRVLHRPAILPTPKFALALMFGSEMVESTLFASQRAVPRKLERAGFVFRHREVGEALRSMV
jgi:uncharacterized protein (TIGR01777 family)